MEIEWEMGKGKEQHGQNNNMIYTIHINPFPPSHLAFKYSHVRLYILLYARTIHQMHITHTVEIRAAQNNKH